MCQIRAHSFKSPTDHSSLENNITILERSLQSVHKEARVSKLCVSQMSIRLNTESYIHTAYSLIIENTLGVLNLCRV